jgi:hypothetical protein
MEEDSLLTVYGCFSNIFVATLNVWTESLPATFELVTPSRYEKMIMKTVMLMVIMLINMLTITIITTLKYRNTKK